MVNFLVVAALRHLTPTSFGALGRCSRLPSARDHISIIATSTRFFVTYLQAVQDITAQHGMSDQRRATTTAES